MKRIIKGITLLSVLVIFVFSNEITLSAAEDGAYLVTRTATYTNPATGQPVDGGTNIELGNSMANSIVEGNLLVEISGGRIYVTIGLGMASATSDISVQVNGAGVALTHTGSHADSTGDTCNHYRFEVSSLNDVISPKMYVGAMGRSVQFFVQMHSGTLTPGTGSFVSQMVSAPAQETAPVMPQVEETPKEAKEKVKVEKNKIDIDKTFKDAKGLSKHTVSKKQEKKNTSSNTTPMIMAVVVVLVVVGAGGFVFYKKRGKKI